MSRSPITDIERQRQRQILDLAYEKTLSMLEDIEEMSPGDACRVIDTAAKFNDTYQKEMLRLRLRPTLIEAAAVKGGELRGQEVELGNWASDCPDETSLHQAANEILANYQQML